MALIFSAYALLSLGANLSVIENVRSHGLGFVYFDSAKYIACQEPDSWSVYDMQAHSRGCQLSPPLHPRHREVLGFSNTTGSVSLSGDGEKSTWCFGHASDGGLLVATGLLGGYFPGTEAGHLRCVSGEAHQLIAIEFEVFHGKGDASACDECPPQEGFSTHICSQLMVRLALELSDHFVVLTGMGARRREIEYWLDYCGVEVPTVHLWEHHDYDSSRGMHPHVSRCNVRKVSNIARSLQDSSPPSSVLCLEDFYTLLSDERGATREPRSARAPEAQLSFFSALLAPPSPRRREMPLPTRRRQELLHEVLAVVGAFATSNYSQLNVRSLWLSKESVDLTSLPSSDAVSSATADLFALDDRDAMAWDRGVDQLWKLIDFCDQFHFDTDRPYEKERSLCYGLLSMFLSAELRDYMHCSPNEAARCAVLKLDSTRRAELAALLRYVARASAKLKIRSFRSYEVSELNRYRGCRLEEDDASSVADDMSAFGFQLFLLSYDLDQRNYRQPILCNGKWPTRASEQRWGSVLDLDVFYAFGAPTDPAGTAESYFDFPMEFTAAFVDPGGMGRDKSDAVRIKNSEGKVYILVFVQTLQELKEARVIIQYWREACPGCRFNAVFSLYMLPSCSEFASEWDSTAPVEDCRMRFALLAVYEWIVTNTVKVDIVVALIGVDAMLSLRHPGVSPSGIVPEGVYGSFAYYRLLAPVVFASTACGNTVSDPPTASLDFRAFAGVASALKSMIEHIRDKDPMYVMGPNYRKPGSLPITGITEIVRRYISGKYVLYNLDEIIDTSCKYFDFNAGSWDSRSLKSSLPERIEQVEGLYSRSLTAAMTQEVLSSDDSTVALAERSSIELGDVVAEISRSAELMNRMQCLESAAVAARVYLNFPDVVSQFPTLLHFYLELSKKFYLYSHCTSLSDKLKMLAIFRELDRETPARLFQPHTSGAEEVHKIVFKMAQTAIYQEIGVIDEEVKTFGATIVPASFRDVQAQRALSPAAASKNGFQSISQKIPRMHIITVASDETPGLTALRSSAYLSGVHLEVVGLGRKYEDYTQKIVWFLETLNGENTTLAIADDDVVVLIDAYDVLLFPAIRQLPQKLKSFNTPIVFCAENGIYPEFAGTAFAEAQRFCNAPLYNTSISFDGLAPAPWFYHRGAFSEIRDFNEYNQGDQKFLNSGCVAGTTREVRNMLVEVSARNQIFRDDQQLFVRYFLENPHLVSIDVDRKLFLTGYKEPMHRYALSFVLGLEINDNEYGGVQLNSVSLMHCNNKDSNGAYYSVLNVIQEYRSRYLQGRDGPALLAAVHAIWDNQNSLARSYLLSEAVSCNSSGLPGRNPLSRYLMKYVD